MKLPSLSNRWFYLLCAVVLLLWLDAQFGAPWREHVRNQDRLDALQSANQNASDAAETARRIRQQGNSH